LGAARAAARLRDKLAQAQALLRHQVPDGNLAVIFERALDLLVTQLEKQRFGLGRKARPQAPSRGHAPSRHVPAAIRRAVFERDGGQCSFVDARGRRCSERGFLEIDHVQGFARKPEHSVETCRLLCRSHNQAAADRLYGRAFMEQKRRAQAPPEMGEAAASPAD
jgi:5-methylcytosine-specific restriction endonuclease McrA